MSGNAENLDEIVKLLALQQMRPSRAACRINAIRSMTGGKRVVPSAKMREQARERAAVLERATEENRAQRWCSSARKSSWSPREMAKLM